MLRFVSLYDEAGRPVGFEASGHAGDAAKGGNLACAAASALIQTLVDGLSGEMGLTLSLTTGKDGFLSCLVQGVPDQAVQDKMELLLRVVGRGLESIAEMDRTKSTVVLRERRREVTRSMENGT
ncbi:MAG TPA: ribosomal-processing cysteine protease Prp [Spirochaetota bacterium]|nr:ribosomal-processing cysteine protease Prp [Spirochaetota bacterium]HPH03383.1 ribosomal-processing cysteine protease Prp [Spirochaetota bacterium]HPN82502.1 ribosomal-processing cysteine protease Prp [Spirochaetota bacterium]